MQDHYRVFLDLVARKNPDVIEEIRRDSTMEITWMDIFKDAIDERVNNGKQEAWQEARFEAIRNVMESLQVSSEKAMEVLRIPQNQRATYAGLVKQA